MNLPASLSCLISIILLIISIKFALTAERYRYPDKVTSSGGSAPHRGAHTFTEKGADRPFGCFLAIVSFAIAALGMWIAKPTILLAQGWIYKKVIIQNALSKIDFLLVGKTIGILIALIISVYIVKIIFTIIKIIIEDFRKGPSR